MLLAVLISKCLLTEDQTRLLRSGRPPVHREPNRGRTLELRAAQNRHRAQGPFTTLFLSMCCLLAFCTEEILANRLMISSRLHGIVEKDHTQYVSFMRPGRYCLEIQEMIHQPDPRRWLMLIIVLSAALVVVLDAFIVNVAIPSIQRSLHASFAELQLVVAGYTLAFAVLLVIGGRMGDLYGCKRVFVLGMASFTLFSGCCGLAPNALSLIVFRIVQGAAAALMFPQVVSFIQVSFEQAER